MVLPVVLHAARRQHRRTRSTSRRFYNGPQTRPSSFFRLPAPLREEGKAAQIFQSHAPSGKCAQGIFDFPGVRNESPWFDPSHHHAPGQWKLVARIPFPGQPDPAPTAIDSGSTQGARISIRGCSPTRPGSFTNTGPSKQRSSRLNELARTFFDALQHPDRSPGFPPQFQACMAA